MIKNNFPTEGTIRQYLLGKLDNQPESERRLSEQILFDDVLSEIVDSIEDEIIEDYLDDTVSPADRQAIEQYFLHPAERKQKLQFARLLRNHFQAKDDVLAKKKMRALPRSIPNEEGSGAFAPPRHSHFRTFCELAAAVLLVVTGLVYTSRVAHRLQSQLDASNRDQVQLKNELAKVRKHSVSLEKELQEAQPAILTFWGPIFRDKVRVPVVKIRPWTQQVKVEIGLPHASGNYAIRLETAAGKEVWSQTVPATSSAGLRFDIPAQVVSGGNYCLRVSSLPEPYCFLATIIQ